MREYCTPGSVRGAPGNRRSYRRGVNRPRAVGLRRIRQRRILCRVRTVIETSVFVRYAAEVWSDAERVEFISWIAANPESGDVILRSGGCRKVRWLTAGSGNRGGARVVYFLEREHTVWLLIVYKKAKFDNLPSTCLGMDSNVPPCNAEAALFAGYGGGDSRGRLFPQLRMPLGSNWWRMACIRRRDGSSSSRST